MPLGSRQSPGNRLQGKPRLPHLTTWEVPVALYALWLALGGLTIAGYHTLLVAGLIPKAWVPCSAGVSCADQKLEILNGVQIPWLSLAAFTALTLLLIVYLKKSSR